MLTDRENQILTGNPPAWLFKLLSVPHARRLSIITFNYDTLIEQAVRVHRLYDWSSRRSVNDGDIVNDLPPPPRRGTFGRGEPAASFLLLKLHGSTNTWWVHDDVSGATVNRWGPFGAWGKPVEVDEARRRRELPGRSPFIVRPQHRSPLTTGIRSQGSSANRRPSRYQPPAVWQYLAFHSQQRTWLPRACSATI